MARIAAEIVSVCVARDHRNAQIVYFSIVAPAVYDICCKEYLKMHPNFTFPITAVVTNTEKSLFRAIR